MMDEPNSDCIGIWNTEDIFKPVTVATIDITKPARVPEEAMSSRALLFVTGEPALIIAPNVPVIKGGGAGMK